MTGRGGLGRWDRQKRPRGPSDGRGEAVSMTWGARRCPERTRTMLGDSEDHSPLAGQVPGQALSVSGITVPTLLPALESEHLGQSGVLRPQGLLSRPNPCRWTQAGSGRRQVGRRCLAPPGCACGPQGAGGRLGLGPVDARWAACSGDPAPGVAPRAAPDAGTGAPQDPMRGRGRRAWTWLRGFRSSFQEPIELLEGVGEKTRLSTWRQEEEREGPGGCRLHLLRDPAAPRPPTCAQPGATRPESAARRCPVWEPRVKTRDTSQRDHDRHRPGHRTRWHNHATRTQRHCKNQRENGGFLVSTTQSLKKLDKTYGKSYRNPSEKGTRAKRRDVGRKGHA